MSEVMHVANGKVRALIPKHQFWTFLLILSRLAGSYLTVGNRALRTRPWREGGCSLGRESVPGRAAVPGRVGKISLREALSPLPSAEASYWT